MAWNKEKAIKYAKGAEAAETFVPICVL